MKRGISNLARAALPAAILGTTAFSMSLPALAASVMEEVVVTAQRAEESLQEVPIAVTALTGEMLEDKGIISPSDLQMSAPNVSFTATNFGGSSFSIRGIGRLVIGTTGESGVSTHLDEIAVGTNLNAVEFFDVERVEVLRGPQGTLFGRNATGGSINMVTKKPTYDGVEGFADVEAGDYNHIRVKGAINIPLGETAGVRIAGFKLDRDGYIENTAAGMVGTDGSIIPNIDDDIDGRDIFAGRVSFAWDFSENGNAWIQYNYFDEADDRARITNQVCKRTELPTLGCEADGFGFDSPHLSATTGGIFFGLNGLGTIPFGASGINGVDGVELTHPRPDDIGLRQVHTDFEPVYEYEEKLWTGGIEYDFDTFTVSLLGAYQETDFIAQSDYNVDVNLTLAPSPDALGFGGLWPTSAPAGRAGDDVLGARGCQYADGTAGVFGGCINSDSQTRLFAMDSATSITEYWTGELRLASQFDGAFNFQVGYSQYHSESYGDYYVNANSLDSLGLVGAALLGFPPLYSTMFNVPGNPNDPTEQEGQAIFAEAYFDLTDRMKLTFGLRRNQDDKAPSSANTFLSSTDQNWLLGLFSGIAGAPPEILAAVGAIAPDFQAAMDSLPGTMGHKWGRLGIGVMGGPALGGISDGDRAIMAFHGVDAGAIAAAEASLPFSPERAALHNAVGVVTGFNETRALTGSPTEAEFKATTGRIGIDYQWRDDVMVYGFFSRGYKPGGFNPPIAPEFQDDTTFTFAPEEVDAIEIGFKSTIMDGSMILNGSYFNYDYSGLQVTRIKNNSSINENIDADIQGLELEWIWQPNGMENLAIDGSWSWLDATLADGVTSIDVTNKSGGDSNWINLKNIDPGALTGTNYVAFAPDITPDLVATAIGSLGALSELNGATTPGVTYPNGIPALFSRSFLDAAGVATSNGIPVDIGGNNLPNAPEMTFRLGVQYTWPISAISGDLTLRWDYYWQDDSYAREFNTVGDEIDSWDQHNLALLYESDDGKWQGRLWARNLQNEDNVTGHYLTSDTSGYFRNYFLTEPRVYGLTVRYSFEEE